MLTITTSKPEETLKIGSHLGTLLRPGDFLNLNGDLGAGKTLLTKGIASAFNIAPEEVTSPTFAIINEYVGNTTLYHFDLYRLNSGLELEQVGYSDYFYGEGITIAEWGDLFKDYLPAERLDIELEAVGSGQRKISFLPKGEHYQGVVEKLRGLLECIS